MRRLDSERPHVDVRLHERGKLRRNRADMRRLNAVRVH